MWISCGSILMPTSPVLDMNGIVDQSLNTLRVLAKPRSIPNSLAIDITDLAVGTALTVGDIELPAGVVSLVAETAPVVSGIITRMALEEATSDEADEAADADGDDAAEDAAGDSD